MSGGVRRKNGKYSPYSFIDMTGTRCHRWLVIKVADKDPGGQYRWLCQCDCGNIRAVRGGDLRNGGSQSCGCWAVKCVSKHLHKDNDYPQRNGRTKQHLYRVWRGLFQRVEVYNMRDGFTICERWKEGAEPFIKDLLKLGWKRGLEVCLKDDCTQYSLENIYLAPRGSTTSHRHAEDHPELRNLEGQVFGDLTVLKCLSKNKRWRCECLCACGKKTWVSNSSLVAGSTKTCGCVVGGRWSINFAACLSCKRTDRNHHSRGLCNACRSSLQKSGLLENYKTTKKKYVYKKLT